jgi:diaminohydroxyphosphoribosylaminopyrimidine deaminase/5-amino-6-(5-phosphoribosylamino)uracil reductase
MSDDLQFMAEAHELARQGLALTSPNPAVGAVIVNDGRVVARGSYRYAELKHAEAQALERAGDAARGGTLYINLEPCSHYGRTPPCADALVAAGIRRVVASIADPNPKVNGSGFRRLREAGIAVEVGLMQAEARVLNESFAKFVRTGEPFVLLKAAMTLDGKISTPPSRHDDGVRSHEWITSQAARWHVQQIRHEQDAILVGVGTVLTDNPLLTDRTGLPRRRPLLRVVLDSTLRLPLKSRLVQTARDDVVVFCSFAETRKRAALERAGVRVCQLPSRLGRPTIREMLRRLGEWEIASVIVEGGSLVNWAVLQEKAVDKVLLYYAPKILGGSESIPLAGGAGYRRLSEAVTLTDFTLHRYGPDFAVLGYVHDVYGQMEAPAPKAESSLIEYPAQQDAAQRRRGAARRTTHVHRYRADDRNR